MLLRAAVLAAVLLLSVAALSSATVSQELIGAEGIFDAVKSGLRDAGSVPGAVERVKSLLQQLSTRLKYENALAKGHFQALEKFYNEKIANHSLLIRRDLEKIQAVKSRQSWLAFRIEEMTRNISQIDLSVRKANDRIGRYQDKISAGDARRSRQAKRFAGRLASNAKEIEATNHVIDLVGSSKTLADSFKSALNDALRPDPTPPPQNNGTSVPSLLELEAEAQGVSDLDELRDLLRATFDNLHAYLRAITAEEGERANIWAQDKYWFLNKTAELQWKIRDFEIMRAVEVDKLKKARKEWKGLPKTRWILEHKHKRHTKKLEQFRQALQKITEEYDLQRHERKRQLVVVGKLYKIIMRHVGDTPLKASNHAKIMKAAEPIFAATTPFNGLNILQDPNAAARLAAQQTTLPKDEDDVADDESD